MRSQTGGGREGRGGLNRQKENEEDKERAGVLFQLLIPCSR